MFEIEPQQRLDDGSGLRVVGAEFSSEDKFDWSLFDGYDEIRILTYSAGIGAIVKLLDKHGFEYFECVFGSEKTLNSLQTVMAFQQVAVGDTRGAIMDLPDSRYAYILSRVRAGYARFRVLRKSVAHSKIYLMENTSTGANRVIVGSANLSETAFGGRQSETLVKFDNDDAAWSHYCRQYREIRDFASDEVELPPDRIERRDVRLDEVPVLDGKDQTTLIIDDPAADPLNITVEMQVDRIDNMMSNVPPALGSMMPAKRNGQQRVTPKVIQKIRREIGRIRYVHSEEDVKTLYFSVDMQNNSADLGGSPFDLNYDSELVRRDARLLVDFFENYEGRFDGDVPRLQRDYFMLWSWLYWSPFMCEARNLAGVSGDVFRYPLFAIVYGKSSCGKSSLVDTLITSMFGREYRVAKDQFRKRGLDAIRNNYRRMPAVFDDVSKQDFSKYGVGFIKDENPPIAEEHPCFVLSMNKEQKAFSDEIVRRCMMIYTETALPTYKEELRHELAERIQAIRQDMSGHLYRRYLSEVIQRLKDNRQPVDWMAFSSSLIEDIVSGSLDEEAPPWLRTISWNQYANTRHDYVRGQLDRILRPSRQLEGESDASDGWFIEGDSIIVKEQLDNFNRRPHDWESVPTTLVDEMASTPGNTVLRRENTEEFIERRLNDAPVDSLDSLSIERPNGTKTEPTTDGLLSRIGKKLGIVS